MVISIVKRSPASPAQRGNDTVSSMGLTEWLLEFRCLSSEKGAIVPTYLANRDLNEDEHVDRSSEKERDRQRLLQQPQSSISPNSSTKQRTASYNDDTSTMSEPVQ